MTNRQIPSADNLLGLAAYSLKLVEEIRNYFPVEPEIVHQEPINGIDRFLTLTNVASIAQGAANADYRADQETGNRLGEHVVCGWPVMEVGPAWSHTANALKSVLEHYGWTPLYGKTGYSFVEEGATGTLDGKTVVPIEEVISPDIAVIKQQAYPPVVQPIPAGKLNTLEHFAGILWRTVNAAMADMARNIEDDEPSEAPQPVREEEQQPKYVFAKLSSLDAKGNKKPRIKYYLRFDSERAKLKESRGLQMIEFLLKQRGKEADVQEVDRALANDRPLHIITKGEALAAADDDRPRNEFSAGSNSLTEPAPIEEIKKVEAALKSLQEQSAEADRRDDLRKAKELEALIRKSNDWLKEQERLHREEKKRKGEGTDKESSRNRLKNNLADALEKLREEGMPNLAEHFDRQIKCESYAYRYSPLPSIDWSFEAPSR